MTLLTETSNHKAWQSKLFCNALPGTFQILTTNNQLPERNRKMYQWKTIIHKKITKIGNWYRLNENKREDIWNFHHFITLNNTSSTKYTSIVAFVDWKCLIYRSHNSASCSQWHMWQFYSNFSPKCAQAGRIWYYSFFNPERYQLGRNVSTNFFICIYWSFHEYTWYFLFRLSGWSSKQNYPTC